MYSCLYISNIVLHFFNILFTLKGKADFAHAVSGELSAEQKSILWTQHGVEVKMTSGDIPQGLEVDIHLKVYDASNRFEFPQRYTSHSQVYEVCVCATQDFPLNGLQLSLTNFRQPRGRERCCVMEASRVPSKWKKSLTPKYTFSEIQGQRFHSRNTTVDFSLRTSSCYFAMAGTKQ